jgi:hypothetical protein
MIFEIIIFGSIALLIYLFIADKKHRKDIYLAAEISFIWVFFSGLYGYRGDDYVFLGLNFFAFFAWTAGLVLIKKIYDALKFKGKYLLFIIFYIIGMITIEYIGYNIWNIKLASHYPGIFGIEAMHMPWYGQMYYLTIGWVFVRLREVIRKIRNIFGK